jgi:hypothetical protein
MAAPRHASPFLLSWDVATISGAVSLNIILLGATGPFLTGLIEVVGLKRTILGCMMMRVPERSRAAGGPLRVCPECGRLYWPGGHVRRMQQRLAAWQQEVAPPS